MILYIETKKLTFDEDGLEHEIVLKTSEKEFYGYDLCIEVSDDDVFIQNTMKTITNPKEEFDHYEFHVREVSTWNSFPLYEIVNEKIVDFDYTKYQYFTDTDRRITLASKINDLYNPPSEAKIIRKTLKKMLDHLEIVDDDFEKYNRKIEKVISKLPKNRGDK
ncbi:hypothetical protein ES708_19172 [subsurface metagenome]